MQLNVKLRAIRVTASTRDEIFAVISKDHVHTIGAYGTYLSRLANGKSDTVRVYSIEKHRKIVSRKIVKNKTASSVVITPGHWVGHFYDIPVATLKAGNLRVRQGLRTFEIISK